MQYIARYYTKSDTGITYFLGESGGPISENEIDEIMSNKLNGFTTKLAKDIVLYFNHNRHINPESGSKIAIFLEQSEAGTITINFWLAEHEPQPKVHYTNNNDKLVKIKVPAHCWDLYLGANFVDQHINLSLMLNELKKYDKVVPENTIIRFMMHQDTNYLPPYIYGYFRPINQVTIALDDLNKCNSDSYPIELCYLHAAYYFSIKKNKWNSNDKITEDDLIMLS